MAKPKARNRAGPHEAPVNAPRAPQERAPDQLPPDPSAVSSGVPEGAEALSDASWVPVSDAALAAGVPERTAYNWQKAGKLPSRRVGGVQVVHLGTVRRLARERAGDTQQPPAMPAPAAPPARPGGGREQLDGEQAAILFAEFEGGATPLDLVRVHRLSPALVRAAWREFTTLRDAARDVRVDRLAAVEETVHRLGQAVFNDALPDRVADLSRMLGELRQALVGLPVPSRDKFGCECGTEGSPEVRVRCAACGRERLWGFRPGS